MVPYCQEAEVQCLEDQSDCVPLKQVLGFGLLSTKECAARSYPSGLTDDECHRGAFDLRGGHACDLDGCAPEL